MATKTYYEPKEEAVPWLVGIDMQKFICGYGANFIGSSYVSCVGIGCQPQWGASGYAVTFPIAFNVVYNVLSIPQTTASTSNAYWGRFYITALTKNGFNVSDTGAGSNRWIAIGSAQPQWGFTNNTGRPYITFPFKFSNVFTAISCICHNGSPSEANTVYNVSISGMNIGASGGGSGKYWCAFGVAQQQWGKTISGNNVKTKFPIAFTAFCMLSVSVNSSNGNAAESVFRNGFGYTNKTLSDWILRGPTGDATYFADYIAIGCQPQWRNNPGLWAIPFTEFVAGGITMTRTGSQSSGTWYGDSGTISLTGYTASCATNESWVSNISGSAIAVGL